MELINKSAIVIGGFGGIGSETCKLLLAKGIANLGIFDNREDDERLENIKISNQNAVVKFWKVDITKKSDCETAFKAATSHFEFIDIVIISVGVVDELNAARAIDINLLGTINANLAAIECMSKEDNRGRGGTILTISSIFGLEPSPSYPIYAATKHGIIGFLRSIGTEKLYNVTGIKIVVVCPGFTRPSMASSAAEVIFPYLPLGSPDDRFQPAPGCADCIIRVVLENNETGSIWIIDDSELTQVSPLKYFFPAPGH